MQRFLLASLLATPVLAQTPADTAVVIPDIEVRGARFSGLSIKSGVSALRVEHNLSGLPSTAADVFRQIPSVVTDIEGGVTYRGSNRVGMLINGVPYGLLEEYGGDVLIQLPAMFFDRISMGTYPAITVVPDGAAGALDLESSERGDSPFSVTLGAGWHERYNVGAALNLHPGKFHINAKYNYRKEYRARTFSKLTENQANETLMNNNASARPDVHVADLRIGYDLSPKDRITVGGLYHLMDYSRYGRIDNQVFNLKGEQMKHVLRNRYNDQRQEAYAAEARWRHSFSEANGFHALFNYNNFAYDEDNDYKNENPRNETIVAEDNQFIDQTKRNYYWSMGYDYSAEDWDIRVGYIGRARDEDYVSIANDKKEEGFVLNPAKSYRYAYNRYLNLLYASVGKRWGDFGVELGAQAEFNRSGMDGVYHSRFHLYPRARLTYEVSESGAFSLSYQQRVIRPTGAYLCSFLDNSDATHIIQGNPDLKDEFIHQVELGYQLSVPRFRLTPAVYYRNRSNRIMEVASQVEEETVWRRVNMGHSRTVGADLSGSWNPARFLTIGFSGDLYRDEIDGRTVGYGERKSLLCWDVKGNVNLRLTPTTEVQIDGFYISDQLTPQGEIGSHYSVNAGLSQYLLDRKLRLNLSVNNIFDSLEEVTVIDTPDLRMTQRRNRDPRVAWLTLTYNI